MYNVKINFEYLSHMPLSNSASLTERNPYDIISWMLQRLLKLMPSYFLHPCTAAIWRQVQWNISQILEESNSEWNNEKPLSVQELIDIVKTTWFKEEPMRTLDGKIILKELLINFWNIPVQYRKTIFSELKKHPDGTFLLFCLSLEAAKERILRWEAVSINAFVEDFDHRDFYTTMMNFFKSENINPMNLQQCIDPSLLTIELLEDHGHENLSQGIIHQLKRVGSLGIHLAIDDYSFRSKKYPDYQNRSILIMSSLIENSIPFRIKIDGGIISAVFPVEWHRNMEGNSLKDHFRDEYPEWREIMRQLIIQQIQAFLQAWIIVVLEWVIPAQLPILRNTFWSTQNADTHLLLQGMDLRQDDFEEEK